MKLEVAIALETIVCGATLCGITFAVPEEWTNKRRRDHTTWYCPNGHAQHWPQESEEERLRKALATAQGNLNYYEAGYKRLRTDVQTLERGRAALKGQVTKLRKRAANGVCAACHRTFSNVARHMETKHPNFEPEGA